MSYLDDKGLSYFWGKIRTALFAKQDALAGLPGQVVGFGASGAAEAVPGWSNPNLLDNWYFPDPINQRGIASNVLWGKYAYGIDRWLSFDANVTKWVEGEGIWLMVGESSNAIIDQRIEQSAIPVGSMVTFSALVNRRLISATFTVAADTYHSNRIAVDEYTIGLDFIHNYNSLGVCNARVWKLGLNGTGVLVKAAKLEFGSRQTLAHQDAGGNWVLNDPPPNKALELAKCQRYYIPGTEGKVVVGHKTNGGALMYAIPASLRVNPTAINGAGGAPEVYLAGGWYPLLVSEVNALPSCTMVKFAVADANAPALVNGYSYLLWKIPALSADL